jgi:RHS repeat-associated protein
MNLRVARYLALFALAFPGVSVANNKWYVECKHTCKSCGTDANCKPGVTTYTVGSDYSKKEDADKAAQDENNNNKGADCTVKERQNTGSGGQALTQPGVTTLNYKREGIVFDGAGPDDIKYETVGGIRKPRQLETPMTTVDYTDTADGKGYQVAQYLTSLLPQPGTNGIRAIPSDVQPIAVTIYRNPDGDASSTAGRLDVVHRQKHPQSGVWLTTTIRLTSPQGNNAWKREWFLGDPLQNTALTPYQSVEVTRTPHLDGTETVREITKDVVSDGSLVISKDQTLTYGFYKYADPVVLKETNHTGTGSDLTTTRTYFTNRSDQASFNKPATMRRSDGQWADYTYSGSPLTGVLVTKTVSGWLDNTAPAVGATADENTNKVVIEIEAKNETGTFGREERVQGALVSKTWGERYKDNAGQLIEKSRVETGTATLLTIRTGYPTNETVSKAERGRLKSIEYPDGTVQLYRYQLQGTNRIETVDKGAGSVNGVTSGKRTVSTYTAGEVLIKEVISDIASGVELSAKEVIAFDANGKPTRWAYGHNPDDYSETLYGCCGIDSERSRDGIVTTYTRDALKRPITAVSNGVTLTYTYGKKTIGGVNYPTVSRMKTAGGLSQDLGAMVRDHSGKVVQRISPDLNGDGQPEVASIARDYTARTTTTTNPDGGTVIEIDFADGHAKSVNGTAVKPTAWTYATHAEQGGGLVTTTFAGDTTSTRWTKSFTNLHGEEFKTTAPGTSGEVITRLDTCDNLCRVIKTADADGVTTLFAYDLEGKRYRTAIDLNQNGQIDNADRVADTLRDVVATSPIGAAIRTRNVIYDLSNNPVTVATIYQSTDGLTTRQESLGVANAATSVRANPLDRIDGEWADVTTAPDGTKTRVEYQNWRPVSQARLDTADNVIEGATTGYDALGCVNANTQSRTASAVVTRTSYDAAGQVASVTEDLTSGTDRVTSFGYDAMGRKISTTLPDGSISHMSYWPSGLEKAAWGSQTYPTVKAYSSQGELVELRTWRDNPPGTPDETSTGFDKTTWTYSDRGHLSAKRYADDKGPSYTYTPAGRLHTRAWARGIVTTYGYNSAGELTSTDYSDATPDVAIVFDKLGRQTSVSNGVAKSEFAYGAATLRLDTETVSYDVDGQVGFEFSRTLDRSNDALGRDSGWKLKNGGTVENEVAYGYDSATGRMASVTGPCGTFAYGYTAGSSLIGSVTGPTHTVTNTWLPDRDALLVKENKIGSTTVSRFEYGVNALGQRTNVATSGNAFTGTPTWGWSYNALGEVTQADSSVSGFDRAYEYDAIGNRKKSADSLTLPANDNYTTNALNQYSAVNQSAALSPSYDDDGNATAYPLPVTPTTNSTLTWDGENRLISTTVNNVTTEYLYDAKSRRIAKITGGVTELTIYDAWNPIADYTGTTLAKCYVWGTDLSGTLQGAGGVGGLLSLAINNQPSTLNYFPTYDGNGNVSEYLGAFGIVAAHFEYDAFGRVVAATGSATDFPIRFSTKKEDVESGLNYYGYRFYDAFIGSWISRDRIEEAGGVNLKSMVENDPVRYHDVLGKIKFADAASFPIMPGVYAGYEWDIEAKKTPCEICVSGSVTGKVGGGISYEKHGHGNFWNFEYEWRFEATLSTIELSRKSEVGIYYNFCTGELSASGRTDLINLKMGLMGTVAGQGELEEPTDTVEFAALAEGSLDFTGELGLAARVSASSNSLAITLLGTVSANAKLKGKLMGEIEIGSFEPPPFEILNKEVDLAKEQNGGKDPGFRDKEITTLQF